MKTAQTVPLGVAVPSPSVEAQPHSGPASHEAQPQGRPPSHLASLALALALAAAGIFGGYHWARDKEEHLLHSAAPEFCDAKLHGVALIREALSRPDTLVFFGSSELIPNVPLKGVDFFAESPTGFTMFPVGKAGTTALSVLQKLGCAGEELVGKKVVISLSPSFFQSEQVDAKYFEGNSSKLQLKEFLASDRFSDSLKHDVAEQILKYPKVYEGDWILEFTLRRVAEGGAWNGFLLAVMEPYSALERAVGRMQDHVEAAFALNGEPEVASVQAFRPKHARSLNWDELFRTAEQQSKSLASKARKGPPLVTRAKGSWDKQFVAKMQKAQEWKDFELVLRVLKETGARPLVISMPLHADILEAQGVSEEGRLQYGNQLRELVKKYNAPLVYFSDHESDPVFFVDQNDHIGSKGWWYYNKLLDDFYHDRLGLDQVARLPHP
jgi:D-alanine transfer protein